MLQVILQFLIFIGEFMKKKTIKKKVLSKKKSKASQHIVHKLQKKAEKITKHLKKVKDDIQSAVRLKQIKNKLKGY